MHAPAASRGREAPGALYAVLFASTSIVVGVLWDISWHQAIGRDSFWTPAHLAIYLGGVVAGLTCGWVALHTTFAGTREARAAGVRFWGFRAPFGAWVCIWGALAMLTMLARHQGRALAAAAEPGATHLPSLLEGQSR